MMLTRISFIGLALAVTAATPLRAQDALHWETDLQRAQQTAAQTNRLVLLHFWATWCGPCMAMEKEVFSKPGLGTAILPYYVPCKVQCEEGLHSGLAKQLGVTAIPCDIVITPQGEVVMRNTGMKPAEQYLAMLQETAQKTLSTARPIAAGAPTTPPATSIATAPAAAPPTGAPSAAPPPAAPPVNAARPADDRYSYYYQSGAAAAPPTTAAPTPVAPSQPVAPPSVAAAPTPPLSTPIATPTPVTQPPVTQPPVTQPPAVAAAPVTPPAPRASTPPVGDRYADYRNSAPATPSPTQVAQPNVTPPAAATPPSSPMPTIVPPPAAPPSVASQNVAPPPASSSAGVVAQKPAAGSGFQLPPGCPPLALDGYCPVTVTEKMTWKKGSVNFGAIHRGRTYLFPSADEQQRFLSDPDKFSPVISGNDPVVALETGEAVPGKREFGLMCQDRMFLFSSKASYDKFCGDSKRYAGEVFQALQATDVQRR